jgi:crotonobetainyl-CoA:carnitine CoA-transferase CaiB-like acyl-CoA transferase
MKILDGLKVLDLTTVVSGPYAASLLADLGADVIKVEPPDAGDSARSFESTEPLYTLMGMSPHIMTLARNKRGTVINLRSEQGTETFYDLVRWADVVVDNYRPGVTERLKIDYPSLKAVNPRIITASITGYGLTGPGKDRAALDGCIQAYSGVMGITGEPDGTPMRAGPLIGDMCSGMAGALGILAAITARDRTGVGQQIDISMLDVQLSIMGYIGTMQMMSGLPAPRYGNEHAMHVPYNAYPTKNGFLFLAIVINAHWPVLQETLASLTFPEELADDIEWLASNELRDSRARLGERERINDIMTRIFATREREAWMADFVKAGIPFAPVNSLEEALNDSQALARDMVVDVPHPRGGSYNAPGMPIKMSEADTGSFAAPPLLGQHTVEVLRDVLGYDAARIKALVQSGAVETLKE